MSFKLRARAEFIAIHFLFAVVALAMLHVYWRTGVIATEYSDEAGHTLVEIPLFFRNLLQGHYTLMNMFNAFGTPLIGEPVFNPWAPHTLTFLLFPGYAGLMANKVLVMFLTLEVLYYYALKMGLSRMFAVWAALLSATNPALVFFMNNHPHIGVVLYFTLFLLAFEYLAEEFTVWRLLCLGAAYLMILTGMGIMGIVLSHVFLTAYLGFSLHRFEAKRWLAIAMVLFGAAAFYLPHLISFAEWAPLTQRSHNTVFDYPAFARYPSGGVVLLALSMFIWLTRCHLDWVIVQTLLLPMFAGLGAIYLARLHGLLTRMFFFSLVLTVSVYVLILRFDWLEQIPFFKSTDITRLFWFSLVFVNLGAAAALESLLLQRVRRLWAWAVFGAVALALIYVTSRYLGMRPEGAAVDFNDLILLTTAFGLATVMMAMLVPMPRTIIPVALVVLLLPRVWVFLFVTSTMTATPQQFGLIPRGLERYLEPYSRFSADYMTGDAPDQRLAAFHVFGSASRSIVASRELRAFFYQRGWIEGNPHQYHFTMRSADATDESGIRYRLTKDEAIHSRKWDYVTTLAQDGTSYRLYQRNEKVTPVYCAGPSPRFLDATFEPDSILVSVDQDCPKLVATFYPWPGWRVYVNDVAKTASVPDEVFLSAVDLRAGAKVRFVFAPWWTNVWWLFILAGMISVACGAALGRER